MIEEKHSFRSSVFCRIRERERDFLLVRNVLSFSLLGVWACVQMHARKEFNWGSGVVTGCFDVGKKAWCIIDSRIHSACDARRSEIQGDYADTSEDALMGCESGPQPEGAPPGRC